MLGRIGLPEILIIATVLLVLFGRGKVSTMMGEIGKGISSFKKGLKDSDVDEVAQPATAPQLIEKV